jgi:hypothetical protein
VNLSANFFAFGSLIGAVSYFLNAVVRLGVAVHLVHLALRDGRGFEVSCTLRGLSVRVDTPANVSVARRRRRRRRSQGR